MLNSQETRIYRNVLRIGWNQEKSHFSNTGKILLKQEFSDGLQISMNIKDITIPLIIHYYLSESTQNTTQILTKRNVRFLPVLALGVTEPQHVYALNPVCIVLIVPGHSRREVPRQGCGHINPGIQWRFIAIDIHTNINNKEISTHCLGFV